MGEAECRADVAFAWNEDDRKVLESSSYGGEICDVRADEEKVEGDRSKVQYMQQVSNVIQVLLLMHVSTSAYRSIRTSDRIFKARIPTNYCIYTF